MTYCQRHAIIPGTRGLFVLIKAYNEYERDALSLPPARPQQAQVCKLYLIRVIIGQSQDCMPVPADYQKFTA